MVQGVGLAPAQLLTLERLLRVAEALVGLGRLDEAWSHLEEAITQGNRAEGAGKLFPAPLKRDLLSLRLRVCRDRKDDVLRFTTDTSVWPTNNLSERGVRPLKTQQKISGRLASDDVTQDRLDIRSYLDTARKHGKNAMDVPHDLMLGRPWRPPAPALSP